MGNIYKNIINERIQQYGTSSLTDEEALCVLTGIPLIESKKCLDTYGLAELIRFKDSLELSSAQGKKLELLYHLVKRIGLSEFKEKRIINSSSKAGEYFIKELQFCKNEVFMIALLDSQNRHIKTDIMSQGTINEAAVYPREIVQSALKYCAKSVILAHNHPGGSLQPSVQDIEITKKIKAALQTINTSVVDHIIVADNKYSSLAENGLLNS